MSIKVEAIVEKKLVEKEEISEFPCLMRADDGETIFAISEGINDKSVMGFVVKKNTESMFNNTPIGYFSNGFVKHYFKPLPKGEIITLQNE